MDESSIGWHQYTLNQDSRWSNLTRASLWLHPVDVTDACMYVRTYMYSCQIELSKITLIPSVRMRCRILIIIIIITEARVQNDLITRMSLVSSEFPYFYI